MRGVGWLHACRLRLAMERTRASACPPSSGLPCDSLWIQGAASSCFDPLQRSLSSPPSPKPHQRLQPPPGITGTAMTRHRHPFPPMTTRLPPPPRRCDRKSSSPCQRCTPRDSHPIALRSSAQKGNLHPVIRKAVDGCSSSQPRAAPPIRPSARMSPRPPRKGPTCHKPTRSQRVCGNPRATHGRPSGSLWPLCSHPSPLTTSVTPDSAKRRR